jgi:hypothetical protein
VWAHTNGDGDFVLFDELGAPWQVHSCYEELFGTPDSPSLDIGDAKVIGFAGELYKSWDSVRPVHASTSGGQKRFSLLGTVTHVDKGFVSKSPDFRSLPQDSMTEVRRVLQGRTSLMTIVTGDGKEFAAFLDLGHDKVSFRDIVLVDLKAVRLISTSVFVLTSLKGCWRHGRLV